jgi:hypothetical protein
LMPRANTARGKVRGALPRIPARGTPPETPAAFPCPPIFQNGPRRQGFASPRLRRALDGSGPFRRLYQDEGKAASENPVRLTSHASRWSATGRREPSNTSMKGEAFAWRRFAPPSGSFFD